MICSYFSCFLIFFFFSSRRRHTRWTGDWSSDVCSPDLYILFASITVIWCISMIFQFIDIIVIRYKYHETFKTARLAPDWVFYLCSVVGLLASGVGLYATVTAPWYVPPSQFAPLTTGTWDTWIGGIVVVSLIAATVLYFLGHARIRDDVSDEQAIADALGTAEAASLGTAEKA